MPLQAHPPRSYESEPTPWVKRRSRFALAAGAAILAYLLMALAPFIHDAWPALGAPVPYLASVVVFAGLVLLIRNTGFTTRRAFFVGGGLYLLAGLTSHALLMLDPTPVTHPGHVWFAWPTMWLWWHGCTLPLLTACPG